MLNTWLSAEAVSSHPTFLDAQGFSHVADSSGLVLAMQTGDKQALSYLVHREDTSALPTSGIPQ